MKTTKKHFKIFEKECLRLVKLFGMSDWDVRIEHQKIRKDWNAQNAYIAESRVSIISLNTEWDDVIINSKIIKKVARHEVCHLIVNKLAGVASNRFVTRYEIDAIEEETVNRLTNILSEV